MMNVTHPDTPAQKPVSVGINTVILDPGHGGRDLGALGKNCKEKDVVLAIGLKVGAYLNQYLPDVKVVYTRDKDVFVPLDERAQLANRVKADLFVSIHANYISNPGIKGVETFVLGLHRSKENLEVAKKENSVIVMEDNYMSKYEGFDPNSTESYIIFELMQNVYLDQSIDVASLIQDQFTHRVGRYNRGVKQAGFLVLRETAMPGILVEVGFLSNREEERFVTSEEGQVYLASAIYRAIRDYKEKYEANNSSLAVQVKPPPMAQKEVQQVVPEKSPEPVVKEDSNKKEVVEYRIQVAISKEPIKRGKGPYAQFEDVWEYVEGGIYKYTTRLSSSRKEILRLLPEVKEIVPDCFVVAFRNGERLKH
jgi:N-acetylmuramoyl-L-alanine amidase